MTTPGAAPNVQFGAYGPVADEEPSAAPNGGDARAVDVGAGSLTVTASQARTGPAQRRLWAHENCAGDACGRAQIFRFCVLSLLPVASP